MIGTEVFIVTNPELGWDCVCGVFATQESLDNFFEDFSEDFKEMCVIHEETIQ